MREFTTAHDSHFLLAWLRQLVNFNCSFKALNLKLAIIRQFYAVILERQKTKTKTFKTQKQTYLLLSERPQRQVSEKKVKSRWNGNVREFRLTITVKCSAGFCYMNESSQQDNLIGEFCNELKVMIIQTNIPEGFRFWRFIKF